MADDREDYLTRLGVVLREARKAADLTQEVVADKLDVSTAAIGRWENGANAMKAYDLVRLVRLYGCDPDLVVKPPTSVLRIRRRLGPVSDHARLATLRALDNQSLGGDGEHE